MLQTYAKEVKEQSLFIRKEIINMKKPNDFEKAEGNNSSTFVPISVGGHKAIIKDAVETTSKAGRPMLRVAFDFDKADEQAGYFMDKFKANTDEDKKWPFQAYMYLVTEDDNGNTMRGFKSFCNDVQSSNPGLEIKWGEKFGEQFKGKKIGVVFGEEEYINRNGDKATSAKFKWTCNYDDAPNQKAPRIKELPLESIPAAPVSNDFMKITESNVEEVPF